MGEMEDAIGSIGTLSSTLAFLGQRRECIGRRGIARPSIGIFRGIALFLLRLFERRLFVFYRLCSFL